MAHASSRWLPDLSRAFKRHRVGRPGWFIELHRDRLRIRSRELPPRPGEPADGRCRVFTLATPPGPSDAAHALAEACAVFDAVLEGTWTWPCEAEPGMAEEVAGLPSPARVQQLAQRLRGELVGERMVAGTWERTWKPYLAALERCAADGHPDETTLLQGYLKGWPAGSRARQMGYDRGRALWQYAGWKWPEDLKGLRGNGKAAVHPEGVRAFTDAEITTLRERIQASTRLTPGDLLAWDCLIAFGLRPVELQGLDLHQENGTIVASISRAKKSSKGSSGIRKVPAVPPADWPKGCHDLLQRWKAHGLPPNLLTTRSPGQILSRQLQRLHMPEDLTSYGLRHAFALRLGLELGLHVREAADLMGHSPQVHLQAYGRRIERPALLRKVAELANAR
jgi:integrase